MTYSRHGQDVACLNVILLAMSWNRFQVFICDKKWHDQQIILFKCLKFGYRKDMINIESECGTQSWGKTTMLYKNGIYWNWKVDLEGNTQISTIGVNLHACLTKKSQKQGLCVSWYAKVVHYVLCIRVQYYQIWWQCFIPKNRISYYKRVYARLSLSLILIEISWFRSIRPRKLFKFS